MRIVEHLEAAGRERRGRDAARRVLLLLIQIAEPQARARHDADGKNRPADGRLAKSGVRATRVDRPSSVSGAP